jgi:hypothetical protein
MSAAPSRSEAIYWALDLRRRDGFAGAISSLAINRPAAHNGMKRKNRNCSKGWSVYLSSSYHGVPMSKSHMPPVPPAEQNTKGPGTAPERTANLNEPPHNKKNVPHNLKEQDHQGNLEQNTTSRGRTGH